MGTDSYFILQEKNAKSEDAKNEITLKYFRNFGELNLFIKGKCEEIESNKFIITERVLRNLKLELQLVINIIKDYTENELYYFEEEIGFPSGFKGKLYSNNFDITKSLTHNVSKKIIELYKFIDTALEIIENNLNYDLIYIISY